MSPRLYLGALLVILFLAACEEPSSWPQEMFSSETWRATSEAQRYVFARDIVERQVLIGLTSEQVSSILGAESSGSGLSRAYIIKTGGRGFDQVFLLEVIFDAGSNKVMQVRIRGD